MGTNVWLEVWTDNELGNSSEPHWRNVYLGVYGGFGLAQAIATMVLNIALFITTLNASKAMHKVMLSRVMQSPMAFFDTTPLGRIVNRFAKDVDVCDNTLPQIIKSWIGTTASFLGTVILIIVKLPIFTAVIVPIGVIFYFIQNIYVSTSRQLKRLESISRSPIYSHFGETLTGASTIRAFGLQNKFVLESEQKVDENQVQSNHLSCIHVGEGSEIWWVGDWGMVVFPLPQPLCPRVVMRIFMRLLNIFYELHRSATTLASLPTAG